MTKQNSANFEVGQTGVPPVMGPPGGGPFDVAHSRRSYVGSRSIAGEQPMLPDSEDLGYNTRQEPRMSDPVHEVINPQGVSSSLAEGQFEHALWRQRGMPGKVDYPDGGSCGPPQGKIKAVHHHDYGLGPLVQRTTDQGHDPGAEASARGIDYRHQPAGPGPGYLSAYVDAARLLPEPTGHGSGFPLEHTGSQFECMGDDLIVAASRAAGRQGQ